MAFKIQAERYFTTEVTNLPADTPGGEPQSFTAHFKAIGRKEGEEIVLTDYESQEQFLRDVVVGVQGLLDKNGKPIEFDKKVMDWMMTQADIIIAMTNAYTRGFADAVQGN